MARGTKCPVCSRFVSTQAPYCPACGHPIASNAIRDYEERGCLTEIIVRIAPIVMIFISIGLCSLVGSIQLPSFLNTIIIVLAIIIFVIAWIILNMLYGDR